MTPLIFATSWRWARERRFWARRRTLQRQPADPSVAIKKLEDELAVTLFERSAADVKITDIGACIVAQAEKVLRGRARSGLATAGRDPLIGPLQARRDLHHRALPAARPGFPGYTPPRRRCRCWDPGEPYPPAWPSPEVVPE